MATYRYSSFKFPASGLTGIDADCVKGLRSYLVRRETAINTIETTSHIYTQGPFAGQSVELESNSTSSGTLPISVKGWEGYYEGGVWHGTTGEPLTMPASGGELSKQNTAKIGKGFEAMGDLFCQMAEPVEEHTEATSVTKTGLACIGRVDDFGDVLTTAGGHAKHVTDDYGDSVECGHRAEYYYYQTPAILAVYRIGKTTFKVQPTAQAIDRLRAKILAKKRWFADKLVMPVDKAAQKTGYSMGEINARAAQDVAAMLANATAAAVIDQAQISAQISDIATSTHTNAVQELATVDAMACEAMATTCEATSSAQSGHGGTGYSAGTAYTSNTAKTAHSASTGTPYRFKPGVQVQNIASKSGQWNAALRMGEDGGFELGFKIGSGCSLLTAYQTSRERMQALQKMAQDADTKAQQKVGIETAAPHTYPENEGAWLDYTYAQHARGQEATYAGFLALSQPVGTPSTDTPTPAAPAGTDTPQADGAQAGNCTDPREFSGTDYTDPREFSTATPTPASSQASSDTPGALSITLQRAEGNTTTDNFEPVTVGSFGAADATLHAWSETAPAKGGYDKTDFSIVWPNGDTYSGRYDLKHHTCEPASLTQHMIDQAEFYTGKFCPLHMKQANYDSFLKQVGEDTRSTYAAVLVTLTMMGVYFQKQRPVAIDLRALTHNGMTPNELVGLGVVYAGGYRSESGSGAIVGVEKNEWNPDQIALLITLEDGRQLSASVTEFDENANAGYRLDMKRHGVPYLAQLAAAVATVRAQASAAKQQAAQAHAAALVSIAEKFPQLQRAANTYAGGKLAAMNIRTLLKEAFKGHKFSVTSEYRSVNVNWTDGPTDDEVTAIIGRFDIGASDSQSDYFYTVSTAFSELFGGVQYMHTNRTASDDLVNRALVDLYPNEAARPSLQDWRKCTGAFSWSGPDESIRTMRKHLDSISTYQAPAPKASRKAANA